MVRIATLNLYHWAEPGVAWYDSGRSHDAAGWAAKREWLGATLAEMDAEAVALQEVVSVEALAELGRAVGWPFCVAAGAPRIETLSDGRRAYTRPVNAILSRLPLESVALTPRPGLASALGLAPDRGFRRPPAAARLCLPSLGPAVVISAHLKSPGVAVEDAPLPGFDPARGRGALEALARAHAFAAMQRVFEAAALQHAAMDLVAEAPRRPVFVCGDFNDTPASPAVRALTVAGPAERDGGAESGEGRVHAAEPWRLIDAYRLSPRDLDRDGRRATHRSGARGDVIDFVLVSAALHPSAPDAVGRVVAHRVHDGWFFAGEPERMSDHAGVSVTVAALDERAQA